MFRVVMKLKSLKKPLKDLNKQLFADIENSVTHAWKALDAIQDQLKLDPADASLISKEKEAANVYRDLQSACYSFFIQKTKATWVNQGDNNTRYFHSILKGRSAKNKVFLIENHHVCTPYHCELLLSPITKAEIKETISSIPNHKAPVPNGFSSAFFKDSWHIVGDDVCNAIMDFFHIGKLL
ncbi:uncharacterized protein LOC141619708 [Silene latifolia]|uniref:uncharacterized protein LOC141619708 n=1 Tax=Silene latifolia TaxID=37657 RepID=UPI003D76C821